MNALARARWTGAGLLCLLGCAATASPTSDSPIKKYPIDVPYFLQEKPKRGMSLDPICFHFLNSEDKVVSYCQLTAIDCSKWRREMIQAYVGEWNTPKEQVEEIFTGCAREPETYYCNTLLTVTFTDRKSVYPFVCSLSKTKCEDLIGMYRRCKERNLCKEVFPTEVAPDALCQEHCPRGAQKCNPRDGAP